MNTPYGTQPQDMLSEFEVNLVLANAGKRFANYIIDIFVNLGLAVLLLAVLSTIIELPFDNGRGNSISSIPEGIIYSLIFAIIYGLIEGIFKGKSLGKAITGTRAVNADGTRISFKTAFLRGISRVVPLEPFSALGSQTYPWHDKWTNTYVVDEKESSLPGNA